MKNNQKAKIENHANKQLDLKLSQAPPPRFKPAFVCSSASPSENENCMNIKSKAKKQRRCSKLNSFAYYLYFLRYFILVMRACVCAGVGVRTPNIGVFSFLCIWFHPERLLVIMVFELITMRRCVCSFNTLLVGCCCCCVCFLLLPGDAMNMCSTAVYVLVGKVGKYNPKQENGKSTESKRNMCVSVTVSEAR